MNAYKQNGAVVVTGASTGIGRACAVELEKLGMHVFAGVRKKADADSLARLNKDKLTPIFIDVTDAGSIEKAVEIVKSEIRPEGLHGVVNNAGIGVAAPLEFIDLDELRKQLDVNVVGQMRVTKAFMPFIRQQRGRIVNIGSVSGRMATPLTGPYCASKFAMEGLSDALRLELRPWDIHVALVEPGRIDTPIFAKANARADRLLKQMPAEAELLYRPMIKAVRSAIEIRLQSANPPDRVAKAVIHALTAKRPKTRYLVGADAKFQALLATVLPDKLRDALISRSLGIPSSVD